MKLCPESSDSNLAHAIRNGQGLVLALPEDRKCALPPWPIPLHSENDHRETRGGIDRESRRITLAFDGGDPQLGGQHSHERKSCDDASEGAQKPNAMKSLDESEHKARAGNDPAQEQTGVE